MNCPIETHQFITTWKEDLPQGLQTTYENSWINNVDLGYFGFIPKEPIALILGTFPVPEQRTSGFFYHSDVNLCWKILSTLSGTDLLPLSNKLSWLTEKKIAISDILCKAQRTDENCIGRADSDLNAICYNNIFQFVRNYPTIKDVFLTSGGPTTKSLSGKSAGGWLGLHLREATGRNLKKVSNEKASLTVQLRPSMKHINLHYLITPAPQDDQLGRHLRDSQSASQTLNNINYLHGVESLKEKYKCFQWAVYFSKLQGIVHTNMRQELTQETMYNILMEV
jgi:hypothetical protein